VLQNGASSVNAHSKGVAEKAVNPNKKTPARMLALLGMNYTFTYFLLYESGIPLSRDKVSVTISDKSDVLEVRPPAGQERCQWEVYFHLAR
jgi:hypothetical protein